MGKKSKQKKQKKQQGVRVQTAESLTVSPAATASSVPSVKSATVIVEDVSIRQDVRRTLFLLGGVMALLVVLVIIHAQTTVFEAAGNRLVELLKS